jgi:hypothetical protein
MKRSKRAMVAGLCLISAAMLSKCGGGSSRQTSSPPLTITPASLPNGTLDTPYSQKVQASGGVAPFNWSVIGSLPPNLALDGSTTNTLTILGTPDAAAQAVTFTIKATDAGNQSGTQSYTVSILAEPDTLTLSPPSLSFVPELIGVPSSAQAETVSNTGTSAVVISSVALTGSNATDFTQNDTCVASLAAGASCAIDVTFTPSQLGPRIASITVTDNTAGSPHSVSLSGVGLTSGPNATLSATSLTFGNENPNTTSPAPSVTLSNYGTMPLNITNITTSANFGATNPCGSSLASGAGCTVSVTFTPNATGPFTGTLSVTDNAPGSPQTVSLSGAGVTTNYKLTGSCVAPAGGRSCYSASDSAQCPPGQPVKRLGSIECFGPVPVDTGRSCSIRGIRGVCAATGSSGAGSGAPASEPLR